MYNFCDLEPDVSITMLYLCTRASLYAPYSLLLISNKFWMEGGEGGVGEKRGGLVGGENNRGGRGEEEGWSRVIKFLNSPE
jgi:hypothetical protein